MNWFIIIHQKKIFWKLTLNNIKMPKGWKICVCIEKGCFKESYYDDEGVVQKGKPMSHPVYSTHLKDLMKLRHMIEIQRKQDISFPPAQGSNLIFCIFQL